MKKGHRGTEGGVIVEARPGPEELAFGTGLTPDGTPYVTMTVGGKDRNLPVPLAQQLAQLILQAAAEAESDAGLYRFFMSGAMGPYSRDDAARAVVTIRGFRQMQRSGAEPESPVVLATS